MAAPIQASASQTKTETAASNYTVNQSGQHGLFFTAATGTGATATPAFTDASGNPITWLWILLGGAAVGAVAWFILRKKH